MNSNASSQPTSPSQNPIRLGLRLCWLAVCFAVVSALPTPLHAQVKPKVEEEVQVLYLGKWYDAEVIEVKGKEVLAEFVWVSTKQKVFTRDKVRLLNEVDAMDYSRRWSSRNKTFSINAALKKVTDDSVVLIKPDLKEVTVSLSSCLRRITTTQKKWNVAG